MRNVMVLSVAVVMGLLAGACASHHEEGVKSNMLSQWADVNADTKTTTDAAKEVLQSEGLQDIQATSTNVDGKATAKKADGTKISVGIKKTGDNKSQVSVSVGMSGDSTLGASLAKQIKEKAEAGHMSNM